MKILHAFSLVIYSFEINLSRLKNYNLLRSLLTLISDQKVQPKKDQKVRHECAEASLRVNLSISSETEFGLTWTEYGFDMKLF